MFNLLYSNYSIVTIAFLNFSCKKIGSKVRIAQLSNFSLA